MFRIVINSQTIDLKKNSYLSTTTRMLTLENIQEIAKIAAIKERSFVSKCVLVLSYSRVRLELCN